MNAMTQLVWVGMANAVRALALGDAQVFAPVDRPGPHVVVAGVVDDARAAGAGVSQVHVAQGDSPDRPAARISA